MRAAVSRVWSRFGTVRGRASRPEFWWWALFVFLLIAVTRLIDAHLIVPVLTVTDMPAIQGQPLTAIVSIILLIPGLCVGVRRLHDSNRQGWLILLVLVPVLGALLLLYFYLQPSDEGRNGYGDPDPLPA